MVKFQILVPRGNVRIGPGYGNGGPALETNPADKQSPVASPEGESSETPAEQQLDVRQGWSKQNDSRAICPCLWQRQQ